MNDDSNRVLVVDDDENLLAGLRRQMHRKFTASFVESASRALEFVEKYGPFSVVVSDMNMPEMSGLELLDEIRQQHPHSVAIVLTGDADVSTAARAVNEGGVFRYLSKPCPSETLLESIRLGIDHHRLVVSEADLLTKTLAGSVRMLSQVLSMTMPEAFGMSQEAKSLTSAVCQELGLKDLWQAELSAMLMRIGMVSMPNELFERYLSGTELDSAAWDSLTATAQTGQQLIGAIPRLETVGQWVGQQFDRLETSPPLVSRVLRAVGDYQRFARTAPPLEVLNRLASSPVYDKTVIESLQSVIGKQFRSGAVAVQELSEGMILEQDIKDDSGRLLIRKDTEIHKTLVDRLKSLEDGGVTIVQPIHVRYLESAVTKNGGQS